MNGKMKVHLQCTLAASLHTVNGNLCEKGMKQQYSGEKLPPTFLHPYYKIFKQDKKLQDISF